MATRHIHDHGARLKQPLRAPDKMTKGLLVAAMLAACGWGVDFVASASAQSPTRSAPSGLLDTIMQGPRLRTDPGESADWVKATRPSESPNPVRGAQGEPSRPLMNADAIRKREAELDALRARHDRLAGRKRSTAKYASAAGPPVKKPKKRDAPCVTTCASTIGTSLKK